MTDYFFPPWARVTSQKVDIVSNTASARSIFTGAVQTIGRSGDRWRWAISAANASDREASNTRRALMALRAQLRGQANRVWFADPSYVQRGSFPSQELFTNSNFSSGLTGWSDTNAALSVADRTLRATAESAAAFQIYQSVVLTQYAPHVIRSFIADGFGTSGLNLGRFIGAGNNGASDYGTSRGLGSLCRVTDNASAENQFPFVMSSSAGFTAGSYVSLPWCSVSRCFQIDNGPNLLTYSDQFENAAWSKSDTTVTGNNAIDPEGGGTGDDIEETATTAAHFLSQSVVVSSSAADFSFSVAIKANGRNWGYLRMSEGSGSSQIYQTFDLANGVVGSTSSAGANWSNLRAFIRNLGNGWYYCSIVGRKTNAATTLYAWVGPSNGDSVDTYLGTAGYGIRAWHATLAQSSVPTRLVQTTSTALPIGTEQTGNALYVKGLPASTDGLLLPGDRVQLGTQLNMVTASLDSDAGGRGYLQCANPWRAAHSDNEPIIVNMPMARCILTENTGGWSDNPGGFSDFEFILEEALDQ